MPFISSIRSVYGAQGRLNRASRRRIEATGGNSVSDITVNGFSWRVHRFTGDGTFTVTNVGSGIGPSGNPVRLQVVLAGGGGSGGVDNGGGGGGGGVVDTTVIPSATNYSIVIGSGGPLRLGSENDGPGRGGLNSTGFGLTALGGGAGSGWQNASVPSQGGYNGGSGGGQGTASNTVSGTVSVNPNPAGSATQPGSASGGFGFNGGSAVNSYAGGGGGAGAVGENGQGGGGSSGRPGIGGLGYLLNGRFGSGIGVSDRLSPGGTGGYESSYSLTSNPGSNNGTTWNSGGANQNATASNTGGGGHGSSHNDWNSGAGGSGIVLVRYELF
jgi:hypothetical protein